MKTPITDKVLKNQPREHDWSDTCENRSEVESLARRLELDRAALMEALEECRKLLEFMPLEYVHKDRHDAITYSPDGALAKAQSALSAARANFPEQ